MRRLASRGAALLAAMLTVTLVATFAAAAMWQQWRAVEVESAERTRVQAAWILVGALDWARLILREDRTPGPDHLAEPWAVPLAEARLSTFLAADTSNSADSQAEETFLSGQITDEQAFLNVNTLLEGSNISQQGLRSFTRLFQLLGLPQAELGKLAENLRFASDIHIDNRSAGRAALPPQRVADLAWLGLAPETVAALAPYVTILPRSNTRVNLNTASAEVIYAAIDGISMADAQRLVAERSARHFSRAADAGSALGMPDLQAKGQVDVSSSYFEVRGRLRIGTIVLEERSLVERQGRDVRTVWRERGALEPAALSRAALPR